MKSVAQEVPGILDWKVTFKTNIVNLRKSESVFDAVITFDI